MLANAVVRLDAAYREFLDGRIDRRALMLRAHALGLSAATLGMFGRLIPVGAQDVSPVASPAGDLSYQSITAAEGLASILSDFPMTEPATTGGTIILGNSTGISGTNPILAADDPTVPLLSLVFESLLGAHPKDGGILPSLADHWELAPDGKTYTFSLRTDLTWHDGTPFTAADVIMTFDARSSPDTGSPYTAAFNDAVASYRKIDDYTVEMVASAVLAPIVFAASSGVPIMPKHVWGEIPFANWRTDPGSTGEDPARVIGTGPFRFDSLDAVEDVATLVRNPDYYDQVPYIEKVLLQVWPDMTTAVEALRIGQIDVTLGLLPPSDADALKEDPSVKVAVYDTAAFVFLAYNLDPEQTTLFQDVRTRRALVHALDRQSIVENIYLGYAEVAQGTQAPLSPAYAPDRIRTKYTFDVDKAKQLLADVGWVDADGDGVLELDGQKLAFNLVYASGDPIWNQLAVYAQDAWSAIGVDMTPEPVDFSNVLLPLITGPAPTHDYQMLGTSFGWDASGDQSSMFSTDSYTSGFNFMKYSNPEVDRLNEEAKRTIDDAARIELLIESANLVNDEIPMIIPFFLKGTTGYSSRLNNFFPNWNGGRFWSFPWTWITD